MSALPIAADRLLDPDSATDHLSSLYRLAWSLCGSRHLAEELTQETYVRVLARPRRLRGEDFYYLARTLRNVLSDHWRAERRRPVPVSDDRLAEEVSPDGDAESASRVSEIYSEIGRLPGHLREVVAAVDVAGLTYAEAAELLRIPNGTVMSRLYRARDRLAVALAA